MRGHSCTKTWRHMDEVCCLRRAISSTWGTESTEALANTWSNCERAVSARFPEAVHGKKHLDNFQNKTKLLCRHLEFNNVNITH